jgi:hypothetical protein
VRFEVFDRRCRHIFTNKEDETAADKHEDNESDEDRDEAEEGNEFTRER